MSLDYSKYENHAGYLPFTEESRAFYEAEEIRLVQLFWDDICQEYGISPDHPKYRTLVRMAGEHGHSGGYNDVEYWVAELIELIDL